MNPQVLELFEEITVPSFDQYHPKFPARRADHWETFQEGFEAAVKECAKMVDKDGDSVLALRILKHFGVDE